MNFGTDSSIDSSTFVAHDIKNLKNFSNLRNFLTWRGNVTEFLNNSKDKPEENIGGLGEGLNTRAVNFWTRENLDVLAMTIVKCQQARNLVRKTPYVELDSDENVIRRKD